MAVTLAFYVSTLLSVQELLLSRVLCDTCGPEPCTSRTLDFPRINNDTLAYYQAMISRDLPTEGVDYGPCWLDHNSWLFAT